MAVTAALARTTTYSKTFLLTQDGAAGTTVPIPHTTLIAGLPGGAFLTLLTTILNPNSQDLQRQRLLGDATALAAQDLTNIPHCEVFITPKDGAAIWGVDADVDGVTAGTGELNVTAGAAASTALLTLHFRHTYER